MSRVAACPILLSCCIFFLAGSITAAAETRPDILMIAVDDLRPMLGCYGDPVIRTPNIDRLARKSIVFDRAYCQYAKCGTSRLSLMTGLRPDSIGVFSNRDKDVKAFRKRRPNVSSIPKWLGMHGYHTQSFGKIDHDGWDVPSEWTVAPSPGRPREMWEIVDPESPSGPTIIAERYDCPAIQSPDVADDHLFAGRMTNQVIDALRERPDRPTLMAVGFRRPHLPMVAPKRYFDLYDPQVSWLPSDAGAPQDAPVMAWFNSDGYVGSALRVGLKMPKRPNRAEAISWNGYELRSYLAIPNHGPIDPELQLKIRHAYAACVSYVDSQIGRILDAAESSTRDRPTVIILWSDHGWHLGEKTAWGKMTNYEIATRVPLLISAGGIRRTTSAATRESDETVEPKIETGRTDAIAELVDLYPTICSLANVPLPSHLEGQSLVPNLTDPKRTGDQIALSQYARFAEQYIGHAIRTNRFRWVEWSDSKSGMLVHTELYDHESDPDERWNRASSPAYAARIDDLRRRLQQARENNAR